MRLFCNSGHWKKDSGYVFQEHNERDLCQKIRDRLRDIFPEAEFVPDDLNLADSIKWVNERAKPDDVAVDIHLNSNNSSLARGTSVYHRGQGDMASKLALHVSMALETINRGAIPDTESYLGELGWCRKLKCPGLVLETCFLTNKEDRDKVLQTKWQVLVAEAIVEFFSSQKVEPTKTEDTVLVRMARIFGVTVEFLLGIIRNLKNK